MCGCWGPDRLGCFDSSFSVEVLQSSAWGQAGVSSQTQSSTTGLRQFNSCDSSIQLLQALSTPHPTNHLARWRLIMRRRSATPSPPSRPCARSGACTSELASQPDRQPAS